VEGEKIDDGLMKRC